MRWLTTRSAMGQPTEAAAIVSRTSQQDFSQIFLHSSTIQPVPGLVILETEPAEEGNPYKYRIHTIYSEFNAAAWLVNLGVFVPEGPVTPVPSEKRSPVKRDAWIEAGII